MAEKRFFIFLQAFLYLLLINSISNESYSEIHLIIRGSGNQEVIFNGFSQMPSKIYINGEEETTITKIYGLQGETSNITLRFDNQLESCENMFKQLRTIEEIDLSDFDASKVTSMKSIFHECSSLKKINFGNVDTSSVKDMELTFFGCSSLTSIDISNLNTSSLENMATLFQQCRQLTSVDLSNWDTSKVKTMGWMFESCENLETVIFGNINTSSLENMAGLFCNCYKLSYTDLWHFDTSKVTVMNHMFTNCKILNYLNLSNFDTSKVTTMENMFLDCLALKYLNVENFQFQTLEGLSTLFQSLSQLSVVCFQNETIKNSILSINKTSFCSDNCYGINNTKIDINGEDCLDSCSKSSNNKYEYNSFCYNKCPQGTVVVDGQCLNNECEGKTNSATCKDGTPIGYYFDSSDKIYKKCHEKCNYCYGEGNETNNNCIECKDNLRPLNDSFNITNCYENCEYYYYFDESNGFHCTENNTCPEEYSKLTVDKGQCIYEEVIHTTLLKEITTIVTETLTDRATETIPITEYNPASSLISTGIINTREIINTAEIISIPIDISINKGDTIRESKNIIDSSKAISTSNIVTDTNIIENTFNLEQYGCVGDDPLTLTCSMEETKNNIEIYDILVNNILSTYSGDNGKSIVLEGRHDTIFQITNTKNELELLKNGNLSDNYSLSIIDLAECENKLKEEYNIDEEDSLIFIPEHKDKFNFVLL